MTKDSNEAKKGPALDVHPSVVFKLGEDLISDEVQALVEIIKNSYDANAKNVFVRVVTSGNPTERLPETFFPDQNGYVEIADDGDGMTQATLEKAWLVVSNSPKRSMKAKGQVPKGKRTPIGDKGLGRLASQRLGEYLEVTTETSDSETALHYGFSWKEARGVEKLGDVQIHTGFAPGRGKGTRVLISGLCDPYFWLSPNDRTDRHTYFTERLATLISPFEAVTGLKLAVTIENEPLDFARVGKNLRRSAEWNYTFGYDGGTLSMTARVKLQSLAPSGQRGDIFRELTGRDSGAALFRRLADSHTESFGIVRSKQGDWFLEASQEDTLENIWSSRPRRRGETRLPKPVDPGPVRGELDAFNLKAGQQFVEAGSFDSVASYRELVKSLVGVGVFRDGFGVNVGRDFLQLGTGQTSGRSFYGPRPDNSIGFVAITAAENPQLEEKSDREGFKQGPAYRTLRLILDRFREFTGDFANAMRRTAIEYVAEAEQAGAGITSETPPARLAAETNKELRSFLKEAKKSSSKRPEKAAQLERLERLSARQNVIAEHIKEQEIRLAELFGLASVGLQAEAIAHELNELTAKLGAGAGVMLRASETQRDCSDFAKSVRDAVRAIRRQLGHIEPSLRFARKFQEDVQVGKFLRKLARYHDARLGDAVKVSTRVIQGNDFGVRIAPGVLTQVVDNLVRNAEHWVIASDAPDGQRWIRMEVDAPRVIISDSGPGIDPTVESTLFEPFVGRRRGGRGLGLYIVDRLLAEENCSIRLSTDRNSVGRRQEFEIDLSAILLPQSRERRSE